MNTSIDEQIKKLQEEIVDRGCQLIVEQLCYLCGHDRGTLRDDLEAAIEEEYDSKEEQLESLQAYIEEIEGYEKENLELMESVNKGIKRD